ncbi:hypothetical protein SteCoe_20574 [Stentor coeruleus]|uniref:Uncharacterized protein n=1 Tax=Stentor coeruleus TaxID=5963 RepID=A0A1R2BRH0_9CILI|nr:hypothetical protein SteCoe_20574 [Stentor coeruleus]
MGNSDQGCTCMRPRERNRNIVNWKNSYLESLKELAFKGFKWAESLYGIILVWDRKHDSYFQNSPRWQFFLTRTCSQSALEYHTNPRHKNIFKELDEDFKDSRNPIGAVIIQFSQSYMSEYHDLIKDIILEKDVNKATSTLNKISNEISSVLDILSDTTFLFYDFLGKLLKNKTSEMRGLLITQIFSGEIYRMIYDLTNFLHKDLADTIARIEIIRQNEQIDEKVIVKLRQISIVESPYEKTHYLFGLKNLIQSKNLSETEIHPYIWTHIQESNVKDIFTHLKMIDIFAVEPMDSCFNLFHSSLSSLQILTQKHPF